MSGRFLHFRPILLFGDIEKAFEQIRIPESERNVLKHDWVKNCDLIVIERNRFTRIIFGRTQSPLIFEDPLKEGSQYYNKEYPKLIETISEDMYIDDLVSSSNIIEKIKVIK